LVGVKTAVNYAAALAVETDQEIDIIYHSQI